MIWIICFLLAILLMAVSEYLLHRFWMHDKRGGVYFKEHAVEHHGKGRNDINIEIPILTSLRVAAPIALFTLLFCWQFSVCMIIVAVAHSRVWTWLHGSFHDVHSSWIKRLPLWGLLYRHHMGHHEHPRRNFGAVFGPAVDIIFRTRA